MSTVAESNTTQTIPDLANGKGAKLAKQGSDISTKSDHNSHASLSSEEPVVHMKEKTIYDNPQNKVFKTLKNWMDATCTKDYFLASEKNTMNIGVFILITTVWLLAAHPGTYFLYWISLLQACCFVKRILLYTQYGYQFYLNDFCYISFIFQQIFLHICPGSQFAYFSYMGIAGLINVTYVFKNMIAIHDLEKIYSSMLHLIPFVLMWNVHWNIRGTPEREAWGFYEVENLEFTFGLGVEYMLTYLTYYAFIFTPIYYLIFYTCWGYITENNCPNYVRDHMVMEGGICNDMYKKHGTVYCFLYFSYRHSTMMAFFALMNYFFMFCYPLHTLYMVYITYVLFDRGSTYCIYYYPDSHQKIVEGLDKFGSEFDFMGYKYKDKKVKKTKSD